MDPTDDLAAGMPASTSTPEPAFADVAADDPGRYVWDDDVVDDPRGEFVAGEIPGDVPDALDGVIEVAAMMSVFAAQRYRRIDAMRQEAVDEAERYQLRSWDILERSLRLELAAGLRVTEHTAAGLIRAAEALVHRYPSVLESLSRANVTERHVEVLVDALEELDPEIRDRILPDALALAEAEGVGTFRRGLRRLIDTARHDTLAERHERAAQDRRVVIEPADEGMAWLMALIPAVEARAIHTRLTAIAKVLGDQDGETRTRDQLRADVLGDLLIDGETSAHPSAARGIRATVAVTVPALSLLDQHRVAAGEPPVVEGVGPIPLDVARELCGAADGWMRILTHPETGAVLSVGRHQYRPPPGLRKIAKWRADRCMAPGCGIPASRCEIDHTIAWEHGGHTSLENLAPLCTGHHTLKHHGGWSVTQVQGSGGALEWRSPAGRPYVVEPERTVPVFLPAESDASEAAAAHAPF